MTPERWQEVKQMFAQVLEQKPAERATYLNKVCTDASLRQQVELMIAAHEQGDSSFLEPPAAGRDEGLKSGTKLGPYTILGRIGSGGMGEVYRAHDPKLKRDVAIKVLPLAFVNDPDRLARFQREARTLASLNHPNIASIYGLEDSGTTHALVMELVEGPTLADRIKQGPIPIDEALRIARQICEALEYAHERGIVHRDLKPANVKVTADDTVKILDFGLAKALEGDAASIDIVTSPTISRMATRAGILLGTAAYMSPEQAKGKRVDRRADIWAFGCVLYEMLTGQMAFRGESVTDTLAAVIKSEPDWSSLPAATPTHVGVLLRRCLQKEPRQRLQAIGDARISLDEVLSGAPEVPAVAPSPLWLRAIPWALLGATALAFAVFAWVHETAVSNPVPTQAAQLQIPLPMKPPLRLTGLFALSPDARQLAFVAASSDGIPRIWIRALNALEIRALPGTESVGTLMFWSPDSRFIAFDAGGKLRKIDVSGGPAEAVCALDGLAVGGSWNKDGEIILGMWGKTLMRVSASGGVATPLTALDVPHGDVAHTVPWFLPDGRHFMYLRDTGNGGFVSVGSLDAKPEEQDRRRLVETPSGAVYVASSEPGTGWLLFRHGTALVAQRFDARHLNLSGEPIRVVEEPIGNFLDYSLFTVSTNGTLAYWSAGNAESQLTWFDAQGKTLSTVGERGVYFSLVLSPDGMRALVSKSSLPNWNAALWLLDLSAGTTTRFELDSSADIGDAVWAPDGRRIIFGATRLGQMRDIYQKSVSGAADAEALIKSNEWKTPSSWSPDGRFLLYTAVGAETKGADLWVLPLGDDKKSFPFLRTEFNESDGHFSPDGRWVAYTSDESGRNEVYVRAFVLDPSGNPISASSDKFPVSNDGGYNPLWRADGKEVYYINLSGELMGVGVTTRPVFHAGVPRVLFHAPPRPSYDVTSQWAPSRDGKRFLFLVPESQGQAPFTVVLNWPSLLKK